MARSSPETADMVVVGGGISGLVAATALRRAGASTVLLEARDRVGGRMHTASVGGAPVDLGAHWIGPTQRRIAALSNDLGLTLESQPLEGRHVLLLGERRHLFSGAVPIVSPLGTAEAFAAVARIELRRVLVDRDRPWTSRGARRLDSMTLGHWARGVRSEVGRATIRIVARTVFGAEPNELSFLFFLSYVQSAGGYRALTEFEGGAQDSRLAGGSQAVCDRLAAELGDVVTLSSPVRSVEHAESGAVVRSDRRVVTARGVVMAIAPALSVRIAFEPSLPPAREALGQRMPMGAYMKAVAVYDRPWWRERGLSGLAFAGEGPVQMIVDDSPGAGGPGVLVAFVTGAPARAVGRLDAADRRDALLATAVRALGQEAARPEAFHELNWLEERWSRGAPVGLMGPGTLTGVGPFLREPVGPIHWAGTETATEWTGYMDGAVQAGERAAREVLDRLGRG